MCVAAYICVCFKVGGGGGIEQACLYEIVCSKEGEYSTKVWATHVKKVYLDFNDIN